jgi:methionyl-tRNA formyltransferase
MSSLAAPLVVDLVYRLHGGDIALLDQQGEATFAPKFQKRAGALRLTEPAEVLDRRIRALTPEPGAKVLRADNDVSIGIVSAELVTNVERIAPGELRYSHGLVLLGTGTTPLVLNVVQPAGKKPMPAGDWYRGLPQGVVIHAT